MVQGKKKKGLVVTSLLLAVSVMATACGTSASNKVATSSPAASDVATKTKINIMLPLYNKDAPDKTGPLQSQLEKLTNTDLNITWVPSDSYSDKTSVALAANQFPDVAVVVDMKQSNVLNAARSGMFWDLSKLIKDYPNLSKIPDTVIKNASIDGKLYGLPRLRQLSRVGVIYRKDWATKLGLKTPETFNDLAVMAKAFTENDPDGDGVKDTVGAFDYNMLMVNTAPPSPEVYFGAPNKWGIQNGKVTPSFMYPQFLDTMNWFRDLYQKGYMNQDFALLTQAQAQDLFAKGKGGFMITNTSDANNAKINDLWKQMQTKDPNVKKEDMIDMALLKDNKGNPVSAASDGYYGEIVINKQTVKTEADVRKILAFFDKLGTKEGQDDLNWGLQDIHYKLIDGQPTQTPETDPMKTKEVNNLSQLLVVGADKTSPTYLGNPGKLDALNAKEIAIHTQDAKYAIPSVIAPLISDTYAKQGPELDKLWKDAVQAYIMGKLDEKGWEAVKQDWLKRGGQKIIDEYTDAYNKSK